MTFGPTRADHGFGSLAAARDRADLDAPYGGARADGCGGRGHDADGFGGGPLAVRHAGDPAAAPPLARAEPLAADLFHSAASDLQRIATRVGPAARLVPHVALDAPELARELQAIVRRVDEAAGAGAVAAGDVEELAGAIRALTLRLPADLRDAPEVQDALATLSAALGEVATASGARPSAEPVATSPRLAGAEQGRLARRLLAEASASLAAVDELPAVAGEHEQYARAAASAASQLEVAADLIATHVPPGKARMALTEDVERVSRRVAKVDQWVRAAKLASDPSIATLFRREAALRELVGLDEARRSPLETIDSDSAAKALTTEPQGAARGGTVRHVRDALEAVLGSMRNAIDDFDAGAESGGKPPPSLADRLVDLAVESALGGSLATAFKEAVVATGRALAGSEGEGKLPGKVLDLVWDRGKQAVFSGGPRRIREPDLRKAYVGSLRVKLGATTLAMRSAFDDEAERLERASPACLRALFDAVSGRAEGMGKEALLQYVLSWQTLKARNHEGTPEDPRGGEPEPRDVPSTRDAALAPAFAAAPGVLRVAFPIVGPSPRTSAVREGSGRIEDITSDHLEAIVGAEGRPLRELRLNTAIRVTLGDVQVGGIEILWFPDGDTVKVGWERMDWQRVPLSEARHLAAYARGVPVFDPDLEHAADAEVIEGARLIAERVMASDTKKVLSS